MKESSNTKLLQKLRSNKGRGINCILNNASLILGNPVIMYDITYKLLAHTKNEVKDDILWNELIELGTFSHQTVNFFNRERFIADVANTDVITLLKSKKLKYDRINAKIYDKDDIHIANICVLACYRPFEHEDFKNIEIICEILAEEIQKSEYYQKTERIFEETFISKLIEGKLVNKKYVEKQMADLYSNLKANLYVGVIDITQFENTLTHLVYFRDLIKQIHPEHKYFIYLNNIVVLVSIDEQIMNVKRYLNKLKDFCIANNIYIGISSSFQNLFELQKYYKQAINALNYGLNTNISNELNIFVYNDFRLNCFLNTIKENVDLKALCHPIVLSIQEYDQQNNVAYFNFIYIYLLVGKNQKLAAKKLDMKLSDFRLQLENITTIFSIDWTNGDMVASIFISLNIAKNFL